MTRDRAELARPARSRGAGRSLLRDQRGSVYTEYLAVLALCGLVVAVAIAGLGGPLLELFRRATAVLLLPV